MEFRLQDLINIPLLQELQDKLNEINSFPSAIIDNDGIILTATGWQDLCTKFHRINSESEQECIASDKYILDHLDEANPTVSYVCPHGLLENATPIIIEGKHLGNFFTGQFFLSPPDYEFFKKQAKKYSFDEKAYLEAVAKVPIWPEEKVKLYLEFIKTFIDELAHVGLVRLKEAEAARVLYESEHKFKELFEGAADAIFIADIETGIIVDANKAASFLMIMPLYKIIGLHYSQLHPAKTRALTPNAFKKHVQEVDKRKFTIPVESKVLCSDGSEVPVEILSSKVTINGRECLMGTFRDITERKNAEAELEKYRNNLEELVRERTEKLSLLNYELNNEIEKKKEAEKLLHLSLEKEKELNQLKSRFISTASHEFRTPLTSIYSSVELLQYYSGNFNEEKKTEHLERIKNSVEHLTLMMENVLKISKADAGRLEFTPVITDLYKLCLEVIEELPVKNGDKKNILFNYLSDQKEFLLDPRQMFTILQNLFSNAVKYTPAGLIHLQITSNNVNIEISVRDEGIGIPKEDVPRIFEPFHRATNTENIKGTGLGLSIVKDAVELHKGKITVESEPGKGSTFLVEIPISTN